MDKADTCNRPVVVFFGEQLFCVGLPIVVTCEDSQSLDQGRLNSMPVKRAPDLHCKSGLVPSSLMYNNISTDRRVTPLDPPTQLLTWPHCSSFTDPSTLILEVGRQVLLGQHLALNYWLSRHFLCHVWMCRVRHAAKVFRCFTANVHLVGTITVLPKLFATSGQEVARVVLNHFIIFYTSTNYN